MSDDLLAIIDTRVKTFHRRYFWDHLLLRMNQKRISKDQIMDTLKNYTIIECNDNSEDLRVLLRGKKVYYGTNIIVCLSLLDGGLITCFKNNCDDNHKNINLGNYIPTAKFLKKLRTIATY